MLKRECSPMVFAYLADLVNAIPAADVREVKRGEWSEKLYEDEPVSFFICSNCGDDNYWKANFCPNCGADMREES